MKNRSSNFELLRIISILMVITSHFNIHGNYPISLSYNFNWIIKSIFSLGCVANHIFILLTGYFMVISKPNYKKIINLILDMLFYSISIFFIFFALERSNLKIIDYIKSVFPIFYGNWFCIYYIILYFLIPILNLIINSVNKNKLKKIILICFILFSIIPFFTYNAWNLSNFSLFILSYLIGAYLRLYIPKLENKVIFKYLIIDLSILVISVIIFYYLGIHFNIIKLVINSSYFYINNNSPFVIILSILILLLFKNIDIKYNKFINWISSSVLGIYLIHDNYLVRQFIWQKIYANNLFFNTNYFIIFGIIKIIIIFSICLLIDKIKNIFFSNINNKISIVIYNFFIKIYKKKEY